MFVSLSGNEALNSRCVREVLLFNPSVAII